MKYSEFKAEVEKMGLHLGVYESYIDVVDKHGDTVSCVAKEVTMGIDTDYEDFRNLQQEKKAALFDLLYVISKTPIAEREEEKRYRLRLDVPLLIKKNKKYYCHHEEYGPGVTTKTDISEWKTIFAESEIAEMDITGFEKESAE